MIGRSWDPDHSETFTNVGGLRPPMTNELRGTVVAANYLGIDVAIKEVLPSNEYDVRKYFEREWRIMKFVERSFPILSSLTLAIGRLVTLTSFSTWAFHEPPHPTAVYSLFPNLLNAGISDSIFITRVNRSDGDCDSHS